MEDNKCFENVSIKTHEKTVYKPLVGSRIRGCWSTGWGSGILMLPNDVLIPLRLAMEQA